MWSWRTGSELSGSVPVKHRLAWLQVRDTDKRSEWVTRFRESSQSMGVVVQQVMQACDARDPPACSTIEDGLTGHFARRQDQW